MSAEQNTKKRGMTVKEFFKSTAFKCIMVLLAIVLVCGILLTICYALFNVSDEERLNRVINQIYGYEVEYETVDLDGKTTTNSYGTINSAYKIIDDGNYLINASGTGGYYGKVTCWVVVEMEDDYTINGIGSVVYQSSNETYMNYIKDDAYDYFSESYADGEFYSVDTWKSNGLYGGASYSMAAIVNSVNAALEFVKTQLLGEESALAGFSYTQYINTNSTTYAVAGNTVTYKIVTTGYSPANAFTIKVDVGEGGKITGYEIEINGSTSDYFKDLMAESILDGSLFKDKDAADILAMFNLSSDGTFEKNDLADSSLASNSTTSLNNGAGYSNFLCVYAALFATSNYNTALAAGGTA